MHRNILIVIAWSILGNFYSFSPKKDLTLSSCPNYSHENNPYPKINDIPLPNGYARIVLEKNSFSEWLRSFPLKKNKTVYLFNGIPKKNQTAQFAVLDISVGKKDLQQCADAVMRLRAEYLFGQKKFNAIEFSDNNGKAYRLGTNTDRTHFDAYLNNVFARCGTLSLEKQLKKLDNVQNIKPGDVLIQGGSPGHAMIVMDIAQNKAGKKIYLLAQSYMPAQDIHVVVNPLDNEESPWYEVKDEKVITPEWVFQQGHFKTW